MIQKDTRIDSPEKFYSILEGIGKILVESTGIIIPLGLIISGLTITGMAPSFTSGILALSMGIPFLALIFGAIACFILGMVGLLTPAYIFLAVTLAPSLVSIGFNLMAVHLFIMYYAMLSAITPPVAVGSFLAASIAGSNPMKTAWQSFRLGIVIYFIPFFFVFEPSLILQKGTFSEFLFHFLTAILGIFFLASGLAGYIWGCGILPNLARASFFVSGIIMAYPSVIFSFFGSCLGATVYLVSFLRRNKPNNYNII
jgi:TRAP-type uncharacterized transport system fused permease subunit